MTRFWMKCGRPRRRQGAFEWPVIRVSETDNLESSVVSIGFAKSKSTLKRNLPLFARLYQRVLKVRLMGSAVLALTWTAAGRLMLIARTELALGHRGRLDSRPAVNFGGDRVVQKYLRIDRQ